MGWLRIKRPCLQHVGVFGYCYQALKYNTDLIFRVLRLQLSVVVQIQKTVNARASGQEARYAAGS